MILHLTFQLSTEFIWYVHSPNKRRRMWLCSWPNWSPFELMYFFCDYFLLLISMKISDHQIFVFKAVTVNFQNILNWAVHSGARIKSNRLKQTADSWKLKIHTAILRGILGWFSRRLIIQPPFKEILISNFLAIDFMIKTNDKNQRRFDLQEIIFKCELNVYK